MFRKSAVVFAMLFGNIVLSQTQIIISNDSGDQMLPTVCMGEESYLVCWADNRDGVNKICARMISLSGELEGESFLISSVPSFSSSKIAFNGKGNNFLVVNSAWERGYFISGEGIISDSTEILAENGEICPEALCFDGEKYFIIFYGLYGAYKNKLIGCFMSTAGEIMDTVLLSSNIMSPTDVNLSFNGSDYLLTWLAKESLNYDVYGQLVSREGGWTKIVNKFKITDTDYNETCPRLSTDGKDWLVVWEGDFKIFGKIIYSNGQSDITVNIINNNYSYFPAIGYGNGMYVLVASSSNDLCVSSILRTGRMFFADYFRQYMPVYWTCIAAQSKGYLAIFNVRNEQDYDLYGIVSSNDIYDIPDVPSVKVISNPFIDYARIIGYSGKIQIYDILGREMESTYRDVFGYGLTPGTYFLRLQNPGISGSYSVIKVVKTKGR